MPTREIREEDSEDIPMTEQLRGYRKFTKEEVEFNRISYADYLLERGLLDWTDLKEKDA